MLMGVLASLPKILQQNISGVELVVDSSIAFSFSLFVWYFNIHSLSKFTSLQISTRFFGSQLVKSIVIGILLMLVLVSVHQFLFSHYHFQSMTLMYEFRGILINLTIYMFLYLLYQSHSTYLMGIEMERIKSDNLEAQYELLKQQVKPHFLFNSLSTLKSMIEIQDVHCSDFIVKLSDFYRFTLESRKMDMIPLLEELEILDAYLYLLKARFEDGIDITIDISDKHKFSFIPPFTLQLLVENCIKHNVISLEQPLKIGIYSKGDRLLVQNKLQRKKVSEASTGMGLKNIKQRYQHLLNNTIEIVDDTKTYKVYLPVTDEYPHN